MSTQNKLAKLITRFEIGFDNETKADIDALKDKLDEVTRALSVKNDNHGDRLLAAMQAEAANDSPRIPFLKKMGQWVFEGQDEKWVSAAKDADNEVWLFQVPLKDLATNENKDYSLWYAQDGSKARYLCDLRSSEDWKNSAIDRETVNDVDYLSCEGPKPYGMPTFIAIDEYESLAESVPYIDNAVEQNYWLSPSVPKITDADMQLIFIKNLSEVLIQRMHSMDRFSEDDYHIGGANLMPWDIVTGEYNDNVVYGVVAGTQVQADRDTNKIDIVRLKPKFLISENHVSIGAITSIYFDSNDSFCTITEDELPAFRAALEACYA